MVHKRLIKLLSATGAPENVKGRFVRYNHWGTGIGSNRWRKCTSVFLFSEFHLPRSAYLADALAMRERKATADEIKAVIGQRMSGMSAEVAIGHRLRWFKQMGSRGNVRDIDEHGKCGRMKLFTTMDRSLFMESYRTLFPGAPEPVFIQSEQTVRKSKGAKLEAFLLGCKKVELCASEVAQELGLAVKDIGRAFKSKACQQMRFNGWEFTQGNGHAAKPVLRKETVVHNWGGFTCVT